MSVAPPPCASLHLRPCVEIVSKSKRRRIRDRQVAIRQSLFHSSELKKSILTIKEPSPSTTALGIQDVPAGGVATRLASVEAKIDFMNQLETMATLLKSMCDRLESIESYLVPYTPIQLNPLSSEFVPAAHKGISAVSLFTQCRSARCIQRWWKKRNSQNPVVALPEEGESPQYPQVMKLWMPFKAVFPDGSPLDIEVKEEAAITIQRALRRFRVVPSETEVGSIIEVSKGGAMKLRGAVCAITPSSDVLGIREYYCVKVLSKSSSQTTSPFLWFDVNPESDPSEKVSFKTLSKIALPHELTFSHGLDPKDSYARFRHIACEALQEDLQAEDLASLHKTIKRKYRTLCPQVPTLALAHLFRAEAQHSDAWTEILTGLCQVIELCLLHDDSDTFEEIICLPVGHRLLFNNEEAT